MDFAQEICWADKKTNDGVAFATMAEQQEKCEKGQEPCWFGINGVDLSRIQKTISQPTDGE